MKKVLLAVGLVALSVVSVKAQEAAVETEAVVPVPVETTIDAPASVVEGEAVDMTYTAAPVEPAADCGCSGGAPVEVAPVYTEAAPVADCGCAEPAPVVADCGCEEPAPVVECCEPAPVVECCEAPEPTCCEPRERKYVVRTALGKLRNRRNCCCD